MLRGAGHATGSITVQHLRMQVGGVADHGESPANFGAVLNDPDHVWTRTKPQALMLALGPPLSAPKEEFACSDAVHILFGEIIERPSTSILLPRASRAVFAGRSLAAHVAVGLALWGDLDQYATRQHALSGHTNTT